MLQHAKDLHEVTDGALAIPKLLCAYRICVDNRIAEWVTSQFVSVCRMIKSKSRPNHGLLSLANLQF